MNYFCDVWLKQIYVLPIKTYRFSATFKTLCRINFGSAQYYQLLLLREGENIHAHIYAHNVLVLATLPLQTDIFSIL